MRKQPTCSSSGRCRPGRNQIGHFEIAWRKVSGEYPLALVFVDEPTRPAPHVFPDVVEVHIHGGALPSAGPIFGGGVEHHLDLGGVDGLSLNQRLERLIDVGNHAISVT